MGPRRNEIRPEAAGEPGLSHRGKTRRWRVFFIVLSLPSGHRQKTTHPKACGDLAGQAERKRECRMPERGIVGKGAVRVFFIVLSLPSGHRQKNNTPFRCVVFGDPYGTRTHVTAVKGRCLNHLTNGPDGSGNLTRTDDTPGMNRMLYQLSYAAVFIAAIVKAWPII